MLIPPDRTRCQAEIKEGSFMTLGPRSWRRCENAPTHIATERKKGPDGEKGAMSLCASCLAVMLNQPNPPDVTLKALATGAKGGA